MSVNRYSSKNTTTRTPLLFSLPLFLLKWKYCVVGWSILRIFCSRSPKEIQSTVEVAALETDDFELNNTRCSKTETGADREFLEKNRCFSFAIAAVVVLATFCEIPMS